MKNKRGQELLLMHIFYIIFIVFILVSLVYFTSNAAKGEGIKKRVAAKQIALLLDVAQPETIIILSSDIPIKKEDNQIIAGKENPFSYSFFSPFKINLVAEEKRIEISEKK